MSYGTVFLVMKTKYSIVQKNVKCSKYMLVKENLITLFRMRLELATLRAGLCSSLVMVSYNGYYFSVLFIQGNIRYLFFMFLLSTGDDVVNCAKGKSEWSKDKWPQKALSAAYGSVKVAVKRSGEL